MDRCSCLTILCAIFGVLVHCGTAQTVHFVGGASLWIIPPNNSTYTNWASNQTFVVGDILVFNYFPDRHDVRQVTQASYNACTDDNAVGPLFTVPPTNITLNSTGDHYFICTFSSHCQLGQKLAITVSGGANPPTAQPPATPTTPPAPSPASTQPPAGGPSPATSETPPPVTPTTPATPPPASTQPGAGGPTTETTPPPPRDSASTSLAAGFLLSVLSAGIAMIF